MGFETSDDAAILEVGGPQNLVQTVDFFGPVVDDPFLYGQIAAANALSDIYAMGGTPFSALNILAYPQCLELRQVEGILRGGLEKLTEAEVVLGGGHSITSNELFYGLSVTGWVNPENITRNSSAHIGDHLIITKPIGSGVVINAIQAGLAELDHEALHYMCTLNKTAAQIMVEIGVHACTDITGFGLIGHCVELAKGGAHRVNLIWGEVPIFQGALPWAEMGLVPSGTYKNRDYFQKDVHLTDITEPEEDLLFDPQTSGGLLIAVSKSKANRLVTCLGNAGVMARTIGYIDQGTPSVHVRR